jgi:copper ion binding protein
MEKVTLNVKGMSCQHCVMAVKGSVGALKGVSNVKVDLSGGKVDVEYDPEVVTLNEIKDAIDEQGYEVV